MASVWLFPDLRIVIRGGGDLASGIAFRLYRAGLPLLMMERSSPLFVRRMVSFGNAIFEETMTVEDITSVYAPDLKTADAILSAGKIPVLIDADASYIPQLTPDVVIDARMQKDKLDTSIHDAPLVIGLGPGYTAGIDCHAVIETNRGHRLGRVIWEGSAESDTGTPGTVSGYSAERVLRAPVGGCVKPAPGVEIGMKLSQGDLIATMQNHHAKHEIRAPFPGVLRGLIHPSVEVWKDLKIGDLDPRGEIQNCYTISDKSLAIGGGVLEAILSAKTIREKLKTKAAQDASM